MAASLNDFAKVLDQIAGSLSEQMASAPVPEKPVLKKKTVKAPAKRSAPKKKPAKAKAKKPATKKKVAKEKAKKPAKQPTKMDVVLQTIRRARKGLDTAALQKRTGFDKRTISNSVYKLKKGNKIKSPKKGVYTKA